VSLPVILRPPAEADVRLAYGEFEQIQTGLGRRFVGRVREIMDRIERMPELYGVISHDVRAARVRVAVACLIRQRHE
jgi:toxin ParE1/3/4